MSRTALITGATLGIGNAIAEEFARNGVDLVITARDADALESLAAEWSKTYKVKVTGHAADLAKPGAAEGFADALSARGVVLDYLVNNAGFGTFGLLRDSKLDDEVAMMTLNMTSLAVLTRRFLPQMLERKGKIMNVASTAAFQPGPYMAVYYATKAFVLSFTEALASELAGTGVTVTAFCPGATQSGFQDRSGMHESVLVKGRKLPTSEEVGRAGFRAMMAGRRVYVPGLLNKMLAQSVRFTPRKLVTFIAKKITGPA